MPTIEFVAGWIAGGTGVVLGHPLDTVKTRLQTGNAYSGIFDAFKGIIKKETSLGLYKGMLAPILTVGFLNSILFSVNGQTLKMLHPGMNVENRRELPFTSIIIASVTSTAAQLVPAIPVELVKTRLQVQQNEVHLFHKSTQSPDGRRAFRGPLEMAREIVRKEGVKGLYKGGSVMTTRDMIGYLFYIPVYEQGLRILHERDLFGETACQIIAGGVAGCAGWLSICPIEVVKNRVQTDSTLTVESAIRQVYYEGGVRAFFRGGLVLCLRGFPVNAAIFVVYENMIKTLNRSF